MTVIAPRNCLPFMVWLLAGAACASQGPDDRPADLEGLWLLQPVSLHDCLALTRAGSLRNEQRGFSPEGRPVDSLVVLVRFYGTYTTPGDSLVIDITRQETFGWRPRLTEPVVTDNPTVLRDRFGLALRNGEFTLSGPSLGVPMTYRRASTDPTRFDLCGPQP